jgi:pimeloyl-ACP methyl ester carboxylesterase
MKPQFLKAFCHLLRESRLFGELTSFILGRFSSGPRVMTSGRRRGVLLIPGFSAGDLSLSPLAAKLRELGQETFPSGIWCNLKCPYHTMPHLEKVLRRAKEKTGAKVVIIGHSLGGLYARELARRVPELVERIILLGSPIHEPLASPNRLLRPILEFWHRRCEDAIASLKGVAEPEVGPDPPMVPETLIYSKTDGVVHWQNCIESGAKVEAIEVPSSHCGLPFSDKVFEVIVDRLARPEPRVVPLARTAPLRSHVPAFAPISGQRPAA